LISNGRNWFWKGCKPNFVCALRRRESFIYAADTRNPSAFAALERAAPWIPYLALHPTGFSVPRRLRFARCALTAPFHHHRRLAPEAVCFLWHCPSERLPTFLPSISRPYKPGLRGVAPCGVRTFLPRLAPGAILRPSKTIITIYQPGRFLKQNKERCRVVFKTGILCSFQSRNIHLGRLVNSSTGFSVMTGAAAKTE